MKPRPMIDIIYELDVEGETGGFREEFSISYDAEMYAELDRDSIDLMNVRLRFQELQEKHGSNLMLIQFSVERIDQKFQ